MPHSCGPVTQREEEEEDEEEEENEKETDRGETQINVYSFILNKFADVYCLFYLVATFILSDICGVF